MFFPDIHTFRYSFMLIVCVFKLLPNRAEAALDAVIRL
jgi:hypothetical protein